MAAYDFNADYKTVAAGQTNQILGSTGGQRGDVLSRIVVIPAAAAAVGNIQIKDGANAAITIFTGGTLVDASSFHIELNATSTNGAWQITTGANVSVLAIGKFK